MKKLPRRWIRPPARGEGGPAKGLAGPSLPLIPGRELGLLLSLASLVSSGVGRPTPSRTPIPVVFGSTFTAGSRTGSGLRPGWHHRGDRARAERRQGASRATHRTPACGRPVGPSARLTGPAGCWLASDWQTFSKVSSRRETLEEGRTTDERGGRQPAGSRAGEVRTVGVVMNGVTGRMGTNQHLVRSILAIRDEGGVTTPATVGDPGPSRCWSGRNEAKLRALAERARTSSAGAPISARRWRDPDCDVYFDAAADLAPAAGMERGDRAPACTSTARSRSAARLSTSALTLAGWRATPASSTASCRTSCSCPACSAAAPARRAASSAACCRCAESSATGSSRAPSRRRSARPGTTAPRTAAESSPTCSAALALRARRALFGRGAACTRSARRTSSTRFDERGRAATTATAEDAAYAMFELDGGVDGADQLVLVRSRRTATSWSSSRSTAPRAARSPACATCRRAARAATPTLDPESRHRPIPTTYRDGVAGAARPSRLRQRASRSSGSCSFATWHATSPSRWDLFAGARGSRSSPSSAERSWSERRMLEVPELER